MKTIKIVLFSVIFFGLSGAAFAQKLMPGTYSFSKEKPVYITLVDGTQVEGMLNKVDRKKGILKSMEVNVNGDLVFYRAGQIQNMYIAPSGEGKLGKVYDFLYDATKWDNRNYNFQYFNQGYVYFEQTEVEMGMKTRSMLMQLLNPSFSSKIKVYNDPFASELATGEESSYYVKDGGRPAMLLNQESYKDYFIALFGECQIMVPLKQKASWTQFDNHVYMYTQCK